VGAVHLYAGEAGLTRGAGDAREALDEVEDLVLAQRARARVVAHELQLHRRGRQRLAGHVPRRLPAGMADLHPQVVAVGGPRLRPCLQPPHRLRVARRRIDRDVPRPLEHAPVDHHVAREQQARAAV
jgi:hypothetical protein